MSLQFFLLMLSASFPAASQVGIEPMGVLPGGSTSAALGVSFDGTYVVGNSSFGFGNSAAVLWSRDAGLTPIEAPSRTREPCRTTGAS